MEDKRGKQGHSDFRRICRHFFLYSVLSFWFSISFFQIAVAQVTPFKKSVLDSLTANEFNGSASYAFNLGQDGTSSLTTNANLGLMYSTISSNYELVGNSYFNRFESFSTSNSFYSLARISLFSHNLDGEKVFERRWYPEAVEMC